MCLFTLQRAKTPSSRGNVPFCTWVQFYCYYRVSPYPIYTHIWLIYTLTPILSTPSFCSLKQLCNEKIVLEQKTSLSQWLPHLDLATDLKYVPPYLLIWNTSVVQNSIWFNLLMHRSATPNQLSYRKHHTQ